jgi:hypothetical protein
MPTLGASDERAGEPPSLEMNPTPAFVASAMLVRECVVDGVGVDEIADAHRRFAPAGDRRDRGVIELVAETKTPLAGSAEVLSTPSSPAATARRGHRRGRASGRLIGPGDDAPLIVEQHHQVAAE